MLLFAAGFGWWPVAVAVQVAGCTLTAWRWRDRAAWAGLVAMVAAAGAVVVLRLMVSHNAELCAMFGLVKPSGHTALALVVYGTIGLVHGRHLAAGPRRALRVLCLAVMAWVPAAMVALGQHSVPDALVGGAAGLAGLALCRSLAGAWSAPRPQRPTVENVLGAAASLNE